jgi:predicted nucleotide-binding protein
LTLSRDIYAHIIIYTENRSPIVSLDLDVGHVKDELVKNYLDGKEFVCGEATIKPKDVTRIRIFLTKESVYPLFAQLQGYKGKMPDTSDPWEFVLVNYTREVTGDIIKHTPLVSKSITIDYHPKKIFIVHGSDNSSKLELTRLLEKSKLEPIILQEEPNAGRTLIEKIETRTSDIGYAIILLTPDDLCHSASQEKRARQNVILELGYFIGKLGRHRTCCLYKEGVSLPSDIHGIVYLSFRDTVSERLLEISRELRNAGYDFNPLV